MFHVGSRNNNLLLFCSEVLLCISIDICVVQQKPIFVSNLSSLNTVTRCTPDLQRAKSMMGSFRPL